MADYSFDVDVHGKTDVFSDVTVQGLDDVKVASDLTLKTEGPLESATAVALRTEGPLETAATLALRTDGPLQLRSEVAITQPVVTSSDVRTRLDVEPLVADSCVRLQIAELPPTRIRQPLHGRVAFTVFGVEWFAVESSATAETFVEPLDRGPRVVGRAGVEGQAPDRDRDHRHPGRDLHRNPAPTLRIKLGG